MNCERLKKCRRINKGGRERFGTGGREIQGVFGAIDLGGGLEKKERLVGEKVGNGLRRGGEE